MRKCCHQTRHPLNLLLLENSISSRLGPASKKVGGTSKHVMLSRETKMSHLWKTGGHRVFVSSRLREMLNHQLCWSWFFVCTNFIAVPAGKINMWSRKILKGPFQNAKCVFQSQHFSLASCLVFGELNHTKIENHTQRYKCISSRAYFTGKQQIQVGELFPGHHFLQQRWDGDYNGIPPKMLEKLRLARNSL